MPEIWEIYTDEVYKHLRPLHATWKPGLKLRLGDFGLMVDHMFVHQANIFDIIEDIGESVDLKVVEDDTKDHVSFWSRGTTEVSVYAKGVTDVNGVARVNAGIDIAFCSDKGVFFNAAECGYDMFENKVKLEKIVLKLLEGGHWRKEWAIVTDIVRAGATTVVISGGKRSSITLEAGADVKRIDLADASVRLGISRQVNVGYSAVSTEGMLPLIGLAEVKKKFRRPTETGPLMMRRPDAGATEDVESLYLGQID